MKTKTITLYSFDELSDDAKKKAIENLRDLNVDHDWWNNTYEDFYRMAEYFGITVDLKKTNFTLSYSQGDGSAYTAEVDVLKLVECVKVESWKEYAPIEKLNLPTVTVNVLRVSRLIKNKFIDISTDVRQEGRETYVNAYHEWNYNPTDVSHKEHTNIEDIAMVEFQDFVNSVCKALNKFLFRQLRDECDYRMSDEAIIESIKANEYTFTEHGKLENE